MVSRWYNATFRFKPDLTQGFPDIRPNVGNFIMLEADSGVIVFLAHWEQYSLSIGRGDKVSRGQTIARVGNSSYLTAPHLHINLFDQMGDPSSDYLATI